MEVFCGLISAVRISERNTASQHGGEIDTGLRTPFRDSVEILVPPVPELDRICTRLSSHLNAVDERFLTKYHFDAGGQFHLSPC